ncbi:MAG: signal recognition particle protein [Thermodesulfobacteriota bacterium]
MLDILTKGFRDVRNYLQGMSTLTEENLAEALKLIRFSLLEADVEFQVATSFLDRVKEQALGEIVHVRVKHRDRSLKVAPGDHFVKLCHDELVRLMGPGETPLNLKKAAVSSIMMVGLQGSGKTTTAAKLARLLQKKGRSPMLVAADVYRPAAVEQLKKLGSDLDVPVFSDGGAAPPDICHRAMADAEAKKCDVVIFDTAGRLTIDQPLMDELARIEELTRPENVILVCDAMIGQESVNIARSFNERIQLTGFILTKLDGDARGGAAISIKEATGVPVLFVGMGEGLDRLEEFRPDGLASRILGFGDVVGLVKDFEEVIDEKKAEEDALRMLRGDFTFTQFLDQIKAIKKMGPLQDLVAKLPFFSGGIPEHAKVDDYELVRIESLINSMTPAERNRPDIIDESRMRRIAKGSGRTVDELKDLMAKFKDMRDLFVAMGGGKLRGRWKRMKGLRKMLGGMQGGAQDLQVPSPTNPYGLPEVGTGKQVPKKLSPKDKKKKRKAEKQARKKSKKR